MTQSAARLLVIRHGETQWNRAGRLQGRLDTPLTANGVRQAMAVGENHKARIDWTAPIRFWVSPQGRARQTASILADIWDIPFDQFQPDAALVERSYGQWEGLTQPEIRETRGAEFEANQLDPWNFAMENGESRAALGERLSGWCQGLERGPLHVVVSHSGCLRALRGLYTGASIETVLAYREPQTASVLLDAGDETMIEVPADVLNAAGCASQGHTVWI
ncbi:phosphoglycerate mutase [Devosia limi DSM 17137]|uniref:Phosphoglycerate mutase n=1 Tax=Devosia limi DSM 17137 TaxID=1121477 RepID=A0A0F5LWV8_9HYPH|nr:histidine phosphatase family protein [Devosia limi]KKB86117.1 phosphoglycerate mutase [Devosia limi DSM 17137]SHF85766.1 probable phosphoglycerate mutase [Devosia limi DSM 17137]